MIQLYSTVNNKISYVFDVWLWDDTLFDIIC